MKADSVFWIGCLGLYAAGVLAGIDAAFFPWRALVWTTLIALAYGFVGVHNYPMWQVLLMDGLAVLVMAWANDWATLAAFLTTVVCIYPAPGWRL